MEHVTAENYLEVVDDGAVILEPRDTYGKGVVGYIRESNRLIYSFELLVDALMEDNGLTYGEAVEWLEFNTIRACDYVSNAPLFEYDESEFH